MKKIINFLIGFLKPLFILTKPYIQKAAIEQWIPYLQKKVNIKAKKVDNKLDELIEEGVKEILGIK